MIVMEVDSKSKVQLEVFELESGDRKYQALAINLLEPQKLITVEEMLALKIPAELDWGREVILYGGAPIWLYTYLGLHLKCLPWVAFFDLRTQSAVIVSVNRSSQFTPGDIIRVNLNRTPGMSILVCGAPDSGKSNLSHALNRQLPAIRSNLKLFLHRANWDGEGNHTLENPDADLAKKLKNESKFKIHKHPDAENLLSEYFQYHQKAVKNIRTVVDLAFVDVGGKAEAVKKPVIDECSHYIVISKDTDAIEDWHKLCGNKLKLIAVIHSVLEEKLEVLKTEPFLEIVAGKWEKGVIVPRILLDEICRYLP